MTSERDSFYLKRAFVLARYGLGSTSPNPAVGAIVVKNGKVVGTGFHQKAGGLHAERIALENAGALAEGADLYVTLQPCSHFGKTPPCVDAILEAGIKRVIFSVGDPNESVPGTAMKKLLNGGIDVSCSLLSRIGSEIIRPFTYSLEFKRPFVTLKLALTADGKITTGSSGERWISSKVSRAFVHRLRSRCDAVLVGKNTALIDNPSLTNRLGHGSSPQRIAVDARAELPSTLKMFSQAGGLVLSLADRADIKTVRCEAAEKDKLDLTDAMKKLYAQGITSILCEGGAELGRSMLELGLVGRIIMITAPKFAIGQDAVSFSLSPDLKFRPKYSGRIGSDKIVVADSHDIDDFYLG